MRFRFLYSFTLLVLLIPSSLYSVVQHQLEKRFHVVGVLGGAGDNQSVVILRDQMNNKSYTLKVGQKLPYFKGAKISAITSKEITILYDQKKVPLEVTSNGRSTVGQRADPAPTPKVEVESLNSKDQETKKLLDKAWDDLNEGVDWSFEDLDENGKKEISGVVLELLKESDLEPSLSAKVKEQIDETKNMSEEELDEYLEILDNTTIGE